jgi:hypothetical protein
MLAEHYCRNVPGDATWYNRHLSIWQAFTDAGGAFTAGIIPATASLDDASATAQSCCRVPPGMPGRSGWLESSEWRRRPSASRLIAAAGSRRALGPLISMTRAIDSLAANTNAHSVGCSLCARLHSLFQDRG